MSRENVELVESAYGLFRTGLQTTPDQVDRLCRDDLDAQFALHLPPDYPEGEPVFRAREGMTQFIAMLRDTWSDWRFEPEQFLDAGNRVVVSGRILGEGVPVACGSSLEQRTSGPFARVAQRPCRCIGTTPMPSKPWGCGGSPRAIGGVYSLGRFGGS